MIYYPILEKGFGVSVEKRDADYSMNGCHTHEHYEIFMVLEGSCRMNVYDKLYKLDAGDVALIKPGVSHYNFGLSEHKRLLVEFSDEYISSYFTDKAKNYLYECFDAEIMHLSEEMAQELWGLYNRMSGVISGDNADPMQRFLFLSRIIGEFSVAYRNCSEVNIVRPVCSDSAAVTRLNAITGYIAHNYTTISSLDEIAQECYISKSHMCRMFRAELGVSVVSYINTLKLRYACELLREDKLSMSEIASKCGFHSSQYFSRIFKKKQGITPQEYRKNPRG